VCALPETDVTGTAAACGGVGAAVAGVVTGAGAAAGAGVEAIPGSAEGLEATADETAGGTS
jgi:hypothetical protein